MRANRYITNKNHVVVLTNSKRYYILLDSNERFAGFYSGNVEEITEGYKIMTNRFKSRMKKKIKNFFDEIDGVF